MSDRATPVPISPRWGKSLSSACSLLRAALCGEVGATAQMIRGVSGTALLKIIHTAVTFATAIMLARMLGSEGYGIYAYAISWVTLMGVFAKVGIDQVMVRNVAVYHHKHDWGHIQGMFRFGIILVSAAGLLCALGVAGVAWILHPDTPAMHNALWIACLLLPLQAMATPFGATQQGLGQVVFAQLPTLLITPLAFLAAIGGVYILAPASTSADLALALRIGAVGIGIAIAVLLLHTGMKSAGRPATLTESAYESGQWLKSALPLVLMGSMFMVNANADILMLGSIAGPHEAGIYKVATRGAELLTFSMVVVSTPLGPLIARLHASGQNRKLQIEVRRWAWVAFLPTACLAAVFLFKGSLYLRLFGSEFVVPDAMTALAVLTVGQLIHIAVGPVGLLLIMTGRERDTAISLTVGALLNVIMNALLIPIWEARGAAIATAFSTSLFALLLLAFTLKRLKINPTIIPVNLHS